MSGDPAENEEDMLLARACLAGDSAAIARLDATIISPMVAETARSHRDVDPAELRQVVRERILVGTSEGGPKLATYEGRAPLSAWVRIVAVRSAMTMLRRTKRTETLDDERDDAVLLGALSDDVELAHLRSEYQSQFKDAFHEAIKALPDQDRVVLRLHVVDGLAIDEIGRIYNVHRATAARWLVRIREALFAGTRSQLARRLDLGETEFASLVGILLSRLDVSVERVLGEIDDDPP